MRGLLVLQMMRASAIIARRGRLLEAEKTSLRNFAAFSHHAADIVSYCDGVLLRLFSRRFYSIIVMPVHNSAASQAHLVAQSPDRPSASHTIVAATGKTTARPRMVVDEPAPT